MAEKKKESTLRCVLTLSIIAVVCGVLLAVLNVLLYVAPSLDDITNNIHISDSDYDKELWVMDDVNADYEKGTGATVTMGASLDLENNDYCAVLVKTVAAGKLGECIFAFNFSKTENKLVECVLVTDGSTAGYNLAYAKEKLGDQIKDFEDYYLEITSATVFDDGYSIPKGGATLTTTAIDNAFKLAAKYYYYVYGGGKA